MTPEECFEKYKHLDGLLTDARWCDDDIRSAIIFDLWQAIRSTVMPPNNGVQADVAPVVYHRGAVD